MAEPQFVVLGDCSVDHYLSLDPHDVESTSPSDRRTGYRMLTVPGGAWLLRAVLDDVVKAKGDASILGVESPSSLEALSMRQSLVQVARFPRSDTDPRLIYRMSSRPKFRDSRTTSSDQNMPAGRKRAPVIAVLEHKSVHEEGGAEATRLPVRPAPVVWIHKLSSYVDNSSSLRSSLQSGTRLTVIVLDADTLRATGYQVSKGLSWERTARTAVEALEMSDAVNSVSGPTLIVIRLGHAGFLQRFRLSDNGRWINRILFDPSTIEGEWGDSTTRGSMFGYLSTVTAHLAVTLAELPAITGNRRLVTDDLISASESALRQAHVDNIAAFSHGLGEDLRDLEAFEAAGGLPKRSDGIEDGTVALQASDVATKGGWELAVEAFKLPGADPGELALRTAADIVRSGIRRAPSASPLPAAVPYAQVGQLFAVGCDQLESLRSTKATLDQYFGGRDEKPLSIAVFGQPGAGKSFAVREIARSGAVSTTIIETNLSQIARPSDLDQVFQQARDMSVAGQVPVVFFDEFDTQLDGQDLGWLRYFLSPMQDGKFQSASGPLRLGRSVFVFAGATNSNYEQFLKPLVEGNYDRGRKYPDFVSRLHAHLDVVGIGTDAQGDARVLERLRRAILLRSLVQRDPRSLVDPYTGISRLDRRFVRVLLTIPLRHGARSLESIVRLSRPDDAGRVTLSSLPPSDSLSAHIDPKTLDLAVREGVYLE